MGTASPGLSGSDDTAQTVEHDGPTRAGADLSTWKPNVALALAIRWMVALTPVVLSFFVTWSFARAFPLHSVGIPFLVWWVGLFTLGIVVLLTTERLARRLLPLAALYRLSLVFPDDAPSRYGVAMRSNTTRRLERRIDEVREFGFPEDRADYAETMLEMVAGLSLHDRLTRGHCERVRAYTDMIAEEMKLSEEDASKLRWAALLHDVGKIFVSADILNKEGKPTDEEWVELKAHTWKGAELCEPLDDFLGEWSGAIRNHHERWDGNGYPDALAGASIPLGGRIVAVADAFDVMTSARSYKAPRPAQEARAEVARCAGGQFDPEVSRAFLNIGLGRLRFAVGPLSWLANIQAATQFPVVPLVQPIAALVTTAAVTIIAAGGPPAPPEELAFEVPPTSISTPSISEEPTTTAIPTTTAPSTTATTTTNPTPTAAPVIDDGPAPTTSPITTPTTGPSTTVAPITTQPPSVPVAEDAVSFLDEDGVAILVLAATSPDNNIRFSIIEDPQQGTLEATPNNLGTNGVTLDAGQARVTYRPKGDFAGTDHFTFAACNADHEDLCTNGTFTVRVLPVDDAPEPAADTASTPEDRLFPIAEALVLQNDVEVDGDALTVNWPTAINAHTVLDAATNELSVLPLQNFVGDIVIPHEVCDAISCVASEIVLTVQPVDDVPFPMGDVMSTVEDVALDLVDSVVLANDVEVDGDVIWVDWVDNPLIDESSIPAVFQPAQDFVGPVTLSYALCDGTTCVTTDVEVTVTPDDDAPQAAGETPPPLLEDEVFTITEAELLANDSDTENDVMAIQWGTPSVAGIAFTHNPDVSYTPPQDFSGPVTIGYQACANGLCSPVVFLELTFTPLDDPPTIAASHNPFIVSGTEAQTSTVTTTDILTGITDVDTADTDLTVTYTDPGDGYFTDNGDGTGFTYTPPTEATTDITIPYQVCDTTPNCVTADIILQFDPVDHPPVPTQITVTPDEDDGATITRAQLVAAANDPDSPDTELTFTATTTTTTIGTIEINTDANGIVQTITLQPAANQHGQTTLPLTICDSNNPTPNCANTTINFNVQPVNDLPITVSPPSSKLVLAGSSVVLDRDYISFDADPADGVPTLALEPTPDGTVVEQPNGDLLFTPAPGFLGTARIFYSLCDGISCQSTPRVKSKWKVNVYDALAPNIATIPAQNLFVGVAVLEGPFAVDNPNGFALTYTHNLPTGLSIVEVAGGIEIVGSVDPAFLGIDADYQITVTDTLGATSTSTVFISVHSTGLSPHKGEIILTEVLTENLSWCANGECVTAEVIELFNRGGVGLDLSGWTVQTMRPGTAAEGGDLLIEIGPDSTPIPSVSLWNPVLNPNSYLGLHTRWLAGDGEPSDYTKLSTQEEQLWLVDENGLAVDFVAWSDRDPTSQGVLEDLPALGLGLWDPAGFEAMARFSGHFDNNAVTSMSLATRSDADTAACWEFTTSGDAVASGPNQCQASDAAATVANAANITPDDADDLLWLSWIFANF